MYLNLSVYDYELLNFALVKSVVHYDIILSHLPKSLSFYVRPWPFILNQKVFVGRRHFINNMRTLWVKKP